MPPSPPSERSAPRPVVFLPCRTLDDLPAHLDDGEADDLFAAWTAAWHPRLVAACGMPGWASVDLPPPAGPLLGIVPRSWDDRFAAQSDASPPDAWLVRATAGSTAIAAAALAAIGEPSAGSADGWIDEFRALGLAVLFAHLLARRMRSEARLESTGLAAAASAAAVAATVGHDDAVRASLAECYRCLEASRARYYPVDVWLVDLVLFAASTPGRDLRAELAAPPPLGIVAEARAIEALAARDPDAVVALDRRVAAGTAAICGGQFVERPLDACLPEEILDALSVGSAAWERSVGRRPAVFARQTGGGSALLPQVLSGLGFTGAVWGTFDGTSLPDPGAGRVLWEGSGGATVEALARPPLDARSAAEVLALPARLADAMDHDHVAVVTFAHHAGTASEWHGLVRRIGAWSDLLGTFVAPDDLVRRTAGAGSLVAFGPDAFPPTPPPAAAGDPLGAAVETATAAAQAIIARAAELGPAVTPAAVGGSGGVAGPGGAAFGLRRALDAWWPGSRRGDGELVLESTEIRVAVHPERGGILALSRPGGGPNRLSQQLAPRGLDGHGRMVAESIERGPTTSGAAGIVSRGRLLDAAGREAGTFVQELSIMPGQPLVAIDVEVHAAGSARGPLAGHHVACRFAWHENVDVEIRRSIHAQAVTTSRSRFTAPHFVEIVPAARRGAAAEPVTILCGGLPWHERSSPHVLDTILADPAGSATRRLAVGIGVERPWDAALELLAGVAPGSGPRPGPAHVRVTVHEVEHRDGVVARARIGILESTGTAGRVRLEWARDVAAATARELDGRPRPGTTVAIEGRGVVVFLRAYEWLAVDLEFA
jgi:alpha-mannosidase